jgi:hypothetical protein
MIWSTPPESAGDHNKDWMTDAFDLMSKCSTESFNGAANLTAVKIVKVAGELTGSSSESVLEY